MDFSYEVSRSLAACQGALLLVDCSQGVQAQTVANYHAAKDAGLTIVRCTCLGSSFGVLYMMRALTPALVCCTRCQYSPKLTYRQLTRSPSSLRWSKFSVRVLDGDPMSRPGLGLVAQG